MTQKIYRLDEADLLVSPNVGDAEIRQLDFEFPNLRVRLVQPFDGTEIDLYFTGIRFLYFHTDNPQNVIDRIHVYNSWERAQLPDECDRNVLKREFGSADGYVVVVDAIAGGPLVCGARDLSIHCVPKATSK
jgi:hypothetical protein